METLSDNPIVNQRLTANRKRRRKRRRGKEEEEFFLSGLIMNFV